MLRKLTLQACIIVAGILPQFAEAQENMCPYILGIGNDSAFYQLPLGEENYNPKKVVMGLIQKQCPDANMQEVHHASCHRFRRNDPESEICYIETKYGYFFITKDYMENINVIYSRLD